MVKLIKTAGCLFAAYLSTGAVYAVTPSLERNDVNITQQSNACSGVVKDALGEPVIGASVLVKGKSTGTITDLDGKFSLPNVKVGDVIQISYVGCQTQEIVFNGKPLDVTLVEDSQTLNEVVVTALGIKREKKALGYSVSSVKSEDITSA
ncbi:MAG: carboxypeptidase-like regulatory domain-containing protein, partial [Mediterranea sp.]|nr:carboxypeptidase-like regulatory domain-containing protein [Mediterranea sp.]